MPEPPRCGSSLASLAGWELTGWGEARGVGENILESFPRCCSSSAAPEEKIPSPALGAAGFPVAPPESRDKGRNFLSFAFSWLFFFNPSLKEFLNSHWGDESRMSPLACALFGIFSGWAGRFWVLVKLGRSSCIPRGSRGRIPGMVFSCSSLNLGLGFSLLEKGGANSVVPEVLG